MSPPRIVALLLAGIALLALGGWLGARYGHRLDTAQAAATATPPQPARRILHYRHPMGLADTSPVPRKDAMGMDYVPVYEGEHTGGNTVVIAPERVQLLGVTYATVAPRTLVRTVRAVGTIAVDERSLYTVAPRYEGWIERLHVNQTGQAVHAGQPLFEVYGPALVSAQEEYLLAREADAIVAAAHGAGLGDSALQRLRNWDVASIELDELRRTGKVRRSLPYRAPVDGVVLEKMAVEGMRFMPGEALFRLADLSRVWLIVEVYEQDLGAVRLDQDARIAIDAFPGQEFSGRVGFLYPELNAATRTARVRIELPNPEQRLQPGQFARVELGTSPARAPVLAVPENAVIDSGARRAVLVARGKGLFEPREVELGVLADGWYEVRRGLAEGERVVLRANFLIDAESNLRGAFQSLDPAPGPDATAPATGHEEH